MNIFCWIKERRLKYDILATFSALLCITMVCEIIYSSSVNRDIVLKFEKDHYSKKVSLMSANWLNSYFQQIELIVNILSQNNIATKDNRIGFNDFEGLFKEGLKKTSFTLSFYAALKDGTYLRIFHPSEVGQLATFRGDHLKKLPSYVSYAVQRIEKTESGQLTESWNYLNDDFTVGCSELLVSPSFIPSRRAWYIKAEQARGPTWTDVYLFKVTGLPGITVSSPILDSKTNETQGVVAIDFALQDFRKLLMKIKATEHSSVRLINARNEIIASTFDRDNIDVSSESKIVLKDIADTSDEILKEAARGLIGTGADHITYEIPGRGKYIASMQKLEKVPFSIFMIIPQSDFTSSFKRVEQSMILISIFTFLISAAFIFWLSKRISDPIVKLCKSAEAIGNMSFENYSALPRSSIFEIQELSSAMNSMKFSISTFSKYAPKDLVRKLLNNGTKPELGGQSKEVTILFSHIDNFHSISVNLPAEYLILLLSEYFDELTKNIMRHNGTIDKYVSDSIMALWGAPTPDDNQALHACETAIKCQEILGKLTEKWAPLGKPPLPTRIGIHTGTAIVGNIGSRDRMNFTAIGDSVNIASRLEGSNKFYGTKIIVSDSVEERVRGKIIFRVIDRIAVKGRTSGITIFEPLCSIKETNDMYYEFIELCSKSKEAFELYQNQKFGEALKVYNEIVINFPNRANAVKPLAERCRQFLNSPPHDWDGVFYLKNK